MTPGCDHKPFGWIPKVYEQRRKLEQAGDYAHKALKYWVSHLPAYPPEFELSEPRLLTGDDDLADYLGEEFSLELALRQDLP
jgi:hypothetical protein